ncbi:MAG: hypothetical protein IT452_01985 [Planctomycetia bacterium]|nr:hypothetical protein [Planctomycetia bacterium]
MDIRHSRGLAGLVVVAALFSSGRLSAQDPGAKTALELRCRKGDSWVVDEEVVLHLALKLTPRGGESANVEQATRRTRSGDLTVVKADGERIESVRVTYGPGCRDAEQVAGEEPVVRPSGLAGRAVTVRRKENGDLSVKCDGDLTDEEKDEARAAFDPGSALLPARAVAPGDRWTAGAEALPRSLSRALGIEDGDKVKVSLRLEQFAELNGRRVAGVEAKITVDEKRESGTSKVAMEGAIIIDAATGVPVAMDLKGTLTASGTFDQEREDGTTVKVAIEGKGDVTYLRGLSARAAGGGEAPAANAFGHMRFTPPDGWTATAYANGVRVSPAKLPEGGHLDITILEAVAWTGTLDEGLERSWADFARISGLDTTNTVEGRPFQKRQTGTSFKGWDYARGEGYLRSADGDYYVNLMVVKIQGRLERIAVASKQRSWRGRKTCYEAPGYGDAVQKFLFSIQFDDWKDPDRPPATLQGEGIVGVWTGLSMTLGKVGAGYAIFFSNGQVYYGTKFPIHGLDRLETWVQGEMQQRLWGSWTFKDGQGVMKLPYQEAPMRMAGESLVLNTLQTDHKFVRLPSVDGARFDGIWAFTGETGKPAIAFTPDGKFRDTGAVSILNHDYPLDEAPGEGTYEVRNYTLILRFSDGREYRIAFPGLGWEKGNQRPQRLILSFNEDPLERQ